MTSQSGSEFFRSYGVSERHISEILNGATRAAYGQNADSVNALSAGLANVLDTWTITRGGPRQVFENFVREANATLFLGSQVSTFRMSKEVGQFLTDSVSRSRASNGTRTPTRGR
jgi:prenylcysteine oxidase/farnesylcysteine lyase